MLPLVVLLLPQELVAHHADGFRRGICTKTQGASSRANRRRHKAQYALVLGVGSLLPCDPEPNYCLAKLVRT